MIHDSILIIGPTASGKTKLATKLASMLNGEIISADSRQVYKELNIGAGKDYNEYIVDNIHIPYHLIDCASIAETFYVKDFITNSRVALKHIQSKNKLPIFCGGTGLYIDTLLKNYERVFIPENHELRNSLESKSNEELVLLVQTFDNFESYQFDLKSRKRLIRAIQILQFSSEASANSINNVVNLKVNPLIIGLNPDIAIRKMMITIRLESRLKNGLIEEVENLLKNNFTHDQLVFLGLEYKFVSMYLRGLLSRDELQFKLNIAINQFAKRQMTWFRKMEREGFHINWITNKIEENEIVEKVKKYYTETFGENLL